MEEMNLAVIYARKSTEDKEKQVASISDQLHEADKTLKLHELKLIKTFTEEKTGKVSGVRTAFYEMLDLIEQGKADTIVTWKADRLARNGGDGGRIIEMVDKGIIKRIITPFCIYERNNCYMLWVEFLQSTKFSKDLSDTVKRRLVRKCEMGLRPGVAPVGYLNTPTLLKGERKILEDPQRFVFMRKWWEMMLSGNYSIKSSLKVITDMGLRDRKLGKIGYHSAQRIFRNIFYAGIFDYAGIRYNGSYKPVVTLSEFMRVQRLIDQSGKHIRTNTRLPFQGMLKCGECGATITGEKHARGKKVFWYYRCKKNKGKCGQLYLNADEMNPQIKLFIKEFKLEPEFCEWLRGVLKRRNTFEFELSKKQKEAVTKELQALEERKEIICKMRIDKLITEEQYQKKADSLLLEERKLQESEVYNRGNYWMEILNKAINFSEEILKLYDTKDVFIRQQILKILGRTVFIKDKKVYIEAKSVFIGLKNEENKYFGKREAVEQSDVPILPQLLALESTKINPVPRV